MLNPTRRYIPKIVTLLSFRFSSTTREMNSSWQSRLLAVPKVAGTAMMRDRKSTRLNSSHLVISYAVFCLKKKKKKTNEITASKINTRTEQSKPSKATEAPSMKHPAHQNAGTGHGN